MRNTAAAQPALRTAVLALALVALSAAANGAAADSASYTATVSDISNTCSAPVAGPKSGTLTIVTTGERAVVTFAPIPTASGTLSAAGKLRAQTEPSATRFNFSGRVAGSGGTLILVAEMFSGDKPVCSQSWNLVLAKS